jgi:DNA-binding MarR family transcriptional regulator
MSKETGGKRARAGKATVRRPHPDGGESSDNGRPEYFEGKLLAAQDLAAEQQYVTQKSGLAAEPLSDNIKTFNQLWATSRSIVKTADGFLRKSTGVSAGMYLLLMALYYEGGSMIPSKLAKKTRSRPNNITALIKKLTQLKMVETARDKIDARVTHITLTKKATAVVEKSLPDVRKFVDRIMVSVDAGSLAAMRETLSLIEKNAETEKS